MVFLLVPNFATLLENTGDRWDKIPLRLTQVQQTFGNLHKGPRLATSQTGRGDTIFTLVGEDVENIILFIEETLSTMRESSDTKPRMRVSAPSACQVPRVSEIRCLRPCASCKEEGNAADGWTFYRGLGCYRVVDPRSRAASRQPKRGHGPLRVIFLCAGVVYQYNGIAGLLLLQNTRAVITSHLSRWKHSRNVQSSLRFFTEVLQK